MNDYSGPYTSYVHLINACTTDQELAELAMLISNAAVGIALIPTDNNVAALRRLRRELTSYREATKRIQETMDARKCENPKPT